ncbi:flagellar protein export ATPase FliI [Herbaspirillum huttiense]|jgi:flagellum-specific ATP synthase|uniref:Flagellum-specific ATP synthase n=1 Tax=Herbaspirillum huttiense subsp. lycopersici TaxID=3074428 RepID=A0ABU2EFH1_9BURK|nr:MULTISPECIES: flagellar protein export ATPase FliI [Herbaspirillum]MAF01656.1 flagellar protein export ATPase FliI [Herbaspirillum sp.]MBN9358536.1 flagellar protein export ATPase FliI [Herbaspirillum huttiense]MBO17628.1 flagellar protein export ATPase FliI [Herbaspirillum sp.]MBP1312974.1 flagellum-specific ATP synthase [Herbaspirillum sp. 1130]MCP3655073.1 flagellar protein export ATPase FliI [Herbaspirillum sp.]
MNSPMPSHSSLWQAYLHNCRSLVAMAEPTRTAGRITRVAGLVMEAVGLKLPVGSPCNVPLPNGTMIEAEVVGFQDERLFLMPQSDVEGIVPGTRVYPVEPVRPPPRTGPISFTPRRVDEHSRRLPVGDELLGRVLDGAGRPLDNLGPLHTERSAPLAVRAANPLGRAPIRDILDTGIRAINTMLTVGRGQRMGLFAGSGVGKSVLLGMMARYTSADVIVVGLIGERGREVKEFIEQILGAEGLARSVVVAAPADTPPLMRLQGAAYCTSIAEYFRDQGKDVLLIMDSLTRYAMAQREIALAIGEPPATKGYPPSVFAKLPALVERAGNGDEGGGSITAFYTVLTEGDDQQDPIADAARAILDGHIVLNRQLAEAGHYPAIDIEQSISRAMHSITDADHQRRSRHLKQLYSRFQRNRDLISVGAYAAGSDPVLDEAIALLPRMESFLQQGIHEQADVSESLRQLTALFG